MSETYLNGEVAVLQAARAKAQETITRLDKALAALEATAATTVAKQPPARPSVPARIRRVAEEYAKGDRPIAAIAQRHGISTPTLYAWLKRAGVPSNRHTGA